VITISVLVTISIPSALSLKDKRAVVRSLVERLRQRLHLAAAEVAMQDAVQSGQVGFAVVCGDRATARRQADEALRLVETELIGRAEILDVTREETELEA
jgi:uncharacterized protein YlxP (DUF503 family)